MHSTGSELLMFTHLKRPTVSGVYKPVGVDKRCFPAKNKGEELERFSVKCVKSENAHVKSHVAVE